MKVSNEETVVYIDGANLHKGTRALGWKLDYKRFRRWLEDKYHPKLVYLFIGLVPQHKDLYTSLQKMGYALVFKEVSYDGTGKVKGNCDADLVLRAAVDYYENHYERAIFVTSDGDYAGVIRFLKEKGVSLVLLSPGKCSFLLRKLNISIVFLDQQQKKIEIKKPPIGTEP